MNAEKTAEIMKASVGELSGRGNRDIQSGNNSVAEIIIPDLSRTAIITPPKAAGGPFDMDINS